MFSLNLTNLNMMYGIEMGVRFPRKLPKQSYEVKRIRYLPVTEYGAGSTPVIAANILKL